MGGRHADQDTSSVNEGVSDVEMGGYAVMKKVDLNCSLLGASGRSREVKKRDQTTLSPAKGVSNDCAAKL